jgi:hypothetical protein
LYKSFGRIFSFPKKNQEEAIQEKIMSDLNLGLFIRSPKNFKSAIEELLEQPPLEAPQSPSFSQTVPLLLKEMEKEAMQNRSSVLSRPLQMFT